MTLSKDIKLLYFSNKVIWKSNIFEDVFKTGGYKELISSIGGFHDLESHPQSS